MSKNLSIIIETPEQLMERKENDRVCIDNKVGLIYTAPFDRENGSAHTSIVSYEKGKFVFRGFIITSKKEVINEFREEIKKGEEGYNKYMKDYGGLLC